MQKIRNLMLVSTGGLAALSGAHAADLPLKAKAVEYVRVCSQYGAGFWYVPGTDTCIKLGGYVRAETTFNGNVTNGPPWSGDFGQRNRYLDNFVSRSRMALTVDTRTATEYGVLRTFGQADFQFANAGTGNPSSLAVASANSLYVPGGGYVAVEYAFIQFAGFTIGKSLSAYSTPWGGYPANVGAILIGGHDSITGLNNIKYTAEFGNGISGTIGLDDPTVYNRTSVYNLSNGLTAVGISANAYAGTHVPEIVGNIRVDQSWGLFQVSAALHEVTGSYNILTAGTAVPTSQSETSGHPESKWGRSVMAALQIRNLPTGAGDDFKIDVSYAKGNTKNVISSSGPSPSFAMFGGTTVPGAYKSVGFGATTDGVWLPTPNGTGDIKLTTAYGVRGGFNHNWNPQWSSGLFGSYSMVRYEGSAGDITTAKGQYCATYAAGKPGLNAPGGWTCNPDFNVAQIGFVTRWTPVKNLTFAGEILYAYLDQKYSGVTTLTPTAPKPTALYEFKNQGALSLYFQARRNF